MRFLKCILVFCFVTAGPWCHSQGQPAEEDLIWYTHKEGLSDNSVQCMVQDHKGFIWLGTLSGLSCFDGSRFFNYYKKGDNDQNSLPSNHITQLLATRDHKIAIGTRFGIAILDPDTRKIQSTPLPYLPGMEYIQNQVISMVMTSDGHIAIGNNGGFYVFDTALKLLYTYHHFKTTDLNKQAMGFAHELIPAANGDVYIRGWHGLFLFNSKNQQVNGVAASTVSFDFPGNYYNTGESSSMLYMDYFPSRIAFINLSNKSRQIWSIDERLSNKIHWRATLRWISSSEVALSSYLNGFQVCKADTVLKRLTYTNDPILQNIHINCFIKDREGRWWLGTENGLYAESMTRKKFKKFQLTEIPGTNKKPTQPTAIIYANGYYFIGSNDNYAISIYDKTFRLKQSISLPPKVYVLWNLEQWEKEKIEVLCSRGWARLDISRLEHQQLSWTYDTTLHSVHDIQPDRSGNLWVGNRNEVYHYTATSKQLKNLSVDAYGSKLPYQGAYRMAMTDSGYVWMAGLPGFTRWNPYTERYDRRFERAPGTKHLEGFPNALFPVPGNRLLFSLDGNGLYQWEGTHHPVKKIAPNFQEFNNIHKMHQAKDPAVCWLTLAQGIGRYHSGTGKTDYLDLALLFPELHQRLFRFYVDTFNHVGLICYPGQVLQFNLNDFNKEISPPKVAIYSVNSIDQQVQYSFHEFFQCRQEHQGLVIHFGIPAFERNREIQYQYRLNGGKDWHAIGKEGSLLFSNLRPGNYQLEIRCINHSGNTGLPATVYFKILPYFYQTWWFLLLCLSFAGGIAYLMFSALKRRHAALEKMRNAIAADLHDEVGASLTSIQILAQLASQEDPAKRAKALSKLPDQVKKTASALKEIVNYIKPSDGTAAVVFSEWSRFAGEALEQSGIAYNIDTTACTQSFVLNPQVQQHLGRMFKEVLHNITKHSEATSVSVEFSCNPHALQVRIKDNGKGFDTSKHYSGHGLSNLQDRATQIKASMLVQSQIGKGTQVVINIPLESPSRWWNFISKR